MGLCNPLPGSTVTESFDSPSAGGPGGKHGAVDLMGPPGSVVYAASDGYIGNRFGSGVQPGMLGIRITGSDGNHYFYNHLEPSSLMVQAGQFVTAGTPIARIGDPSKYGYSFPSHVHFSINEGYSNLQDPYPLLKSAAGCGGGQAGMSLEQSAQMQQQQGGAAAQVTPEDPVVADSKQFEQNTDNVRSRLYQTGESVRNFLTGQPQNPNQPTTTPLEQLKSPIQQMQEQANAQAQGGANSQANGGNGNPLAVPQLNGAVGGTGLGAMTYGGWADAFLSTLGAPLNDSNRALMIAWMRREGTSATWNPLATTQGNFGGTNFNSVGVKNYTDAMTGINAEITALRNGRYPTILAGLMSGNANMALSNQDEWRTWGSGDIHSLYVDTAGSLANWISQVHRAAAAAGANTPSYASASGPSQPTQPSGGGYAPPTQHAPTPPPIWQPPPPPTNGASSNHNHAE